MKEWRLEVKRQGAFTKTLTKSMISKGVAGKKGNKCELIKHTSCYNLPHNTVSINAYYIRLKHIPIFASKAILYSL